MTKRCDRHNCVQCRPTPPGFTDEFSAYTMNSIIGEGTGVGFSFIASTHAWSPAYAREAARRLLDAADEAEEIDRKRRQPLTKEQISDALHDGAEERRAAERPADNYVCQCSRCQVRRSSVDQEGTR